MHHSTAQFLLFSRVEVICKANKAMCSVLDKKEQKLGMMCSCFNWEVVSDSS